jgi:hypothetical protein
VRLRYVAPGVESLGLDDIYLGFVLFFSIVFGTVALIKAPNDLQSIATYVATAGGAAAVAAAVFAVPVWTIFKVAG